jgi:hypothetical protein
MPVAEHAVQLGQIVERGTGGSQHVAPVVAEHVLLEREVLAGRRDELPHARGLGGGHGLRVERALDEGQQRELGRHVAALELFDDVEQVAPTTLGHALHVVGSRGIPLLAVSHQVALKVGNRKAAAHPCPQVGARGSVVEVDDHFGAQRVDRRGHRGFGRCWCGGRRLGGGGCGLGRDDRCRLGGRDRLHVGGAGQRHLGGAATEQGQGEQHAEGDAAVPLRGQGVHREGFFHGRSAPYSGQFK